MGQILDSRAINSISVHSGRVCDLSWYAHPIMLVHIVTVMLVIVLCYLIISLVLGIMEHVHSSGWCGTCCITCLSGTDIVHFFIIVPTFELCGKF